MRAACALFLLTLSASSAGAVGEEPTPAIHTSDAPGAEALTPGEGPGQNHSEARKLFREASRLYDAARFGEALRLVERAYALSPSPDFLINLATLHAALNDCVSAIQRYEQYLEDAPGGVAVDSARRALSELRASHCAESTAGGEAPLPKPVIAATSAPPAAPEGAQRAEPIRRFTNGSISHPEVDLPSSVAPWRTNNSTSWSTEAGWTGLATGAVLAGVSLLMVARIAKTQDEAAASWDGDRLATLERRGERYEKLARGFAVGSLFASGIGVTLLLVRGTRSNAGEITRRSEPSFVGFRYSGRF